MRTMTRIAITGLLAVSAVSVSHAQTGTAADCSEAQAGFVAEMGLFRSAYFEREDAVGSAESVMAERVLPSAEQMYQLCPAQVAAAVKGGVEKAQASLTDPGRAQLVQCDQALVTYKGLLSRYDNRNLSGGYNTYRNLIDRDIDPSAQAAVAACPQMPDLAQEARVEIAERERRLDSMEDIDNQGASYFDSRRNIDEYNTANDAANE